MTAGCTTETESQTSFTGSQMSFPDKVRGAARADSLPSVLGLCCCAWSTTQVRYLGAKRGAIECCLGVWFKRAVPVMHPYKTPVGITEVLLLSRTLRSLTVWLRLEPMVGFDTWHLQRTLGFIRGNPLESQYLDFFGEEICFLPSTYSWHALHGQCPLGIVLPPFRGCSRCAGVQVKANHAERWWD